jgi:hypothetical protein
MTAKEIKEAWYNRNYLPNWYTDKIIDLLVELEKRVGDLENKNTVYGG